MKLQKVAVFDLACPDVNGEFRYHSNLTQHATKWAEDYGMVHNEEQLTIIRDGTPWPLVEKSPGEYDWSTLDGMIARAEELGCTFIPVLTQFSWPLWVEEGVHPVLSDMLPEAFAAYTRAFVERYGSRIKEIIPAVELGTDAWSRASVGHWGPHMRDDESRKLEIEQRLTAAFNASAAVCHEKGLHVISHESVTGLAISLALDADEIGVDHYTHAGFQHLSAILMEWDAVFKSKGVTAPVFSLMERGAPESYNVLTGDRFSGMESVQNRLYDIEYYRDELHKAETAGVRIGKVTAFAIGNFWTDPTFATPEADRECDRNALCDLKRGPNGELLRVVQPELVTAFHESF